MNRAALLLLLLAVSGCTVPGFRLIDRRTFQSTPQAAQAGELARADLPPLPLVTIRFDQPDIDYRPALAAAVVQAQARKPDVAFDVLAPIPTQAGTDVQARFTAQGGQDTQAVALALAADGVAPDHIHMGFRGDPGAPPREVRVYVR